MKYLVAANRIFVFREMKKFLEYTHRNDQNGFVGVT